MTEQTGLTTVSHEALMPAMDIGMAVARYQAMNQFVKAILKEGVDFGKIPGTGDKPTLLKAGAEKLTSFFGLRPTFEIVEKVEDWGGQDHGGESFFYYHYRCRLWRAGEVIAEGDGSCNSRESKYRYRKGERVCPNCQQPAIIKGRAEYGGGWVCFGKKGGCGSKFKDNDTTITGQDVGRVLNPDVADLVNTIQKMAQKRALVAATLIGVNASDYFTQDIEDLSDTYVDAEYRVVTPSAPAETAEQPKAAKANGNKPASEPERKENGGNGKHRQPTIAGPVTTKWRAACVELVKRCEHYAKDGQPDYPHILGAVGQLGYSRIDADNLEQIMQELVDRVTAPVDEQPDQIEAAIG
jgi:hypothetical protein